MKFKCSSISVCSTFTDVSILHYFILYFDLFSLLKFKGVGVTDSTTLCKKLLEDAGLALTSGCDFEVRTCYDIVEKCPLS